jgi:predicted acylesterase/phospholipase RssA
MFQDNLDPTDDIETVVVCSGGGARGLWQWLVLMAIAKRFKISMIAGTSAGSLNSYGFAKGLFEYITNLYGKVFQENAVQITGPGLAKLENGKLKANVDSIKKVLLAGINFFDVFKLPFKKGQQKVLDRILKNFLHSPALLDNAPLFQTVKELQQLNPGFNIPCFTNCVDMVTGQKISKEMSEFADMDEERLHVVASTTIPLVWPLVGGRYADGGLREGTPLRQVFDRLDPNKKYRVIVISCNKEGMEVQEDLSNPLKIGGRMVDIMMNESTLNDISGAIERNEEARKYGEAIGRRYVPIYFINYSGNRGPLDFSPEAYVEHVDDAEKDIAKFFEQYDNQGRQ